MYRSRLLLVLLFAVLPSIGACGTADWCWGLGGDWVIVGTDAAASDDLDSCDRLMQTEPWRYHIAVYKEVDHDGWSAPSGFFQHDIRAPLQMIAGVSKTWRIYVWGDVNYYPSHDVTGITWAGNPSVWSALDTIEFRLTYVRSAVGVVDTANTVGSYIILNEYADGGTWGNFPAIRTENGLDGYVFDLTAKVVPEPSALVGLVGGLGTLGLPAVRRKWKVARRK